MNMKQQTLQARIDDLFKEDLKDKKDEIKFFIERVHTNYADSEKLFRRYTLTLLLFWAVFYAISIGLVEEGQVVSLKLHNVSTLLIAGPPVMGALLYFLSTSLVASAYLSRALSQIYKNILPKAVDLKLENLLAPPTPMGVEKYIGGQSPSRLLNILNGCFLGIAFQFFGFASLIAFLHISLLVWSADMFPVALRVFSLTIAGFFFFRSCVLLATAMSTAP
jgi:hypothetical protein